MVCLVCCVEDVLADGGKRREECRSRSTPLYLLPPGQPGIDDRPLYLSSSSLHRITIPSVRAGKVLCEVRLTKVRQGLPVEDGTDANLCARATRCHRQTPRRHSAQATCHGDEASGRSPALQQSSVSTSSPRDTSSEAIGRQSLYGQSMLVKQTL